MASTYFLLDKSILTSTQTSVEFTGLNSYASAYKDLLILSTARNTSSGGHTGAGQLLLNGNSPTVERIYGSGTSIGADTYAPDGSGVIVESTMTANTFSSTYYYLPNFNSAVNKSVSIESVQENDATGAYCQIAGNLFTVTSGITTITIQPNGGSYDVGSSFYLYGISNT